MAEHFCNEHQTNFFKDGKMKRFAHQIEVNGQTAGWCNEDAEEVGKLPAQKTASPPLQEGEEPMVTEAKRMGAKVISVDNLKNRSMSVAYSKDLVCAGKIELKQLSEYADKFLKYIENK